METNNLCDYGCNQPALYSNGVKKCCSDNWRKCIAVRQKNSNGLKLAYQEHRAGYDYNLLSTEIKKKMSRESYWDTLDWDQIKDNGYRRKRLLKEYGHQCQQCKNTSWQDKPIPLEIDHKDGNNFNWNKNNVWLLCPNCHALTNTYRGKNKNNGKTIINDDDLILIIQNSKNIRSVLKKAHLTSKASNYERIRTLMFSKNLSFIEHE